MSEITFNCRDCRQDFTCAKPRNGKKTLCDSCRRVCAIARCKSYRSKNETKTSEYNRMYKAEHKQEVDEYNKKYNIEKRDMIQARQNKQHRERRCYDTQYKMACLMRSRFNKLVKNKSDSIKNILGCHYGDLAKWFEFQFKPGMSHENHGSHWHVDHIIPCARFNLESVEEQIKCCHWTNLRPLECKINMSRQDKVSVDELVQHKSIIDRFLQEKKDTISFDMTDIDFDRTIYANM